MPDTTTAQPIHLDPSVFKDIQIALLQQQVIRLQVKDQLAQANTAVARAVTAAGLDPQKPYALNEADYTVLPT